MPFLERSLVAVTLSLLVLLRGTEPGCANDREAVFEDAAARWQPGGDTATRPPLRVMGDVTRPAQPSGTGARPEAIVAKLNQGWFDAGTELNLNQSACTIYFRMRDPQGTWRQAFVAKRGSVEDMNINFFASQYPNKPSPEVAFELRTDAGFGRASFLVDSLDRTAWHDLAARYDGRQIELFCDGRWMASGRHRGNCMRTPNRC